MTSQEREWLDDLDLLLAELARSSDEQRELSEAERDSMATRLQDVLERMVNEVFPPPQEEPTVVVTTRGQSRVLHSVLELEATTRRNSPIDAALVERAQEAVAYRRDGN